MNKLVSVIIPNYNKAHYLGTCIESVLSQTYPSIRIIIVDDCSTDSSRELIRSYAAANSRIEYLFHETNKGVSASRNDGAKQAESDYITFLDADDFYASPNKIAAEMAALEKLERKGRHAAAFSTVIFVCPNGRPIRENKPLIGKMKRRFYLLLLLSGAGSRYVIRDYVLSRRVFSMAGGYNEGLRLYEDYDLLIRLCAYCDFVFSGEKGTAYRQISGGLSDQPAKKLTEAKQTLCREHMMKYGPLLRFAARLLRVAVKLLVRK